jgi:hypothetical protein
MLRVQHHTKFHVSQAYTCFIETLKRRAHTVPLSLRDSVVIIGSAAQRAQSTQNGRNEGRDALAV